jgi:hypothetical protein
VLPLLWGGASAAIGCYVRWRYAGRAALVATPANCPYCGSRRHARVGLFPWRVPCRECGRRTVRLESCGIS